MQGGRPSRRRLTLLALTLLGVALIWPASSHAFVACDYSAGQVTVNMTANDDSVTFQRFGDQIAVLTGSSLENDEYDDYGDSSPQILIPCSGGNPTVTNTDRISVLQNAKAEFGSVTIDESAGPFAPGATPEADGTSEIEFGLNLPGRGSAVGVKGSDGPETIPFGMLPSGAPGTNLNAREEPAASADADVEAPGSRFFEVDSEGGDDIVSGLGGPGLVGPLRGSIVFANGGTGNDLLQAAPVGAELSGDEGRDTVIGSPRRDFLEGGTGRDKIFGGHGDDRIFAVDRKKDHIICGSGKRDYVLADFIDRAIHCETGRRVRLRKRHPVVPSIVPSSMSRSALRFPGRLPGPTR
jgi:Ca2+-binding RTX toxin-like protein